MKSNRDWVYNTLAHENCDRIPFNFMFSPPALEKLQQHYKCDSIEDILDFPIRMSAPDSVKPLYAFPDEHGDFIKDEFGVEWTTSYVDRGTPHKACLSEPNLKNYSFPDATAEYRFQGIDEWCNKNRDNFTVIWVGDLWERATFMRGMDKILMDLIIHPKFVHNLLDGLANYIIDTMEILFARYRFDCIAISDDYGTQKGMLMSPNHWRQFVKLLLKNIYFLARKNDRKIFQHSCGNIYPIIPDLIDIGLDILHPVQPEAMDIYKLKAEFGKDLTFCGGIPTQSVLPKGTPNEVRNEVGKLKSKMGKGGGYILEPGITVQADVPLENMIAMIEEAKKI